MGMEQQVEQTLLEWISIPISIPLPFYKTVPKHEVGGSSCRQEEAKKLTAKQLKVLADKAKGCARREKHRWSGSQVFGLGIHLH